MNIIALDIAISILIWLFSIFVLSCTGFIFHIPINPFYTIFSTLLSSIILSYRLKKHDINIRQILLIFTSLIALFLTFGFIEYKFADFSFDGCCYHQATIIFLKWGWNPIYSSICDFSKLQMCHFDASTIFMQCYTKFYEILAANLYSISNKIEFIKVLKFIFSLTSFLYIIHVLGNFKNISKAQLYTLSFLFIYNPVCIYQFFTNYNDDIIYYTFMIFLFSFINFFKGHKDKTNLSIMLMSTVILANIKFTGLCFAAIIYLVWTISYRSTKVIKVGLISLVLILICSINPYFTNIKAGNSPFYPVINGAITNSIKTCITDIPVGFENKNHFEKIFISLFSSASVNSVLMSETTKPTLKIPFTIKNDDKFKYPDMRISGLGYYFGGILILILILGSMLRFSDKDNKKLFFTILISLILVTTVLPGSWWARFVPQMWAIPLFVSMFSLTENRNKYFVYLIFIIIFINSLIVNIQNVSMELKYNKYYLELMKRAPYPMKETLQIKLLERKIIKLK